MKYKVVGWANMVLGGWGVVQQTILLLFVYPKLRVLYEDFGADLPWTTTNYPVVAMIMMVVMSGMVFLGAKLAFNKSPKEWWFVIGLVSLFVGLALGGLTMGTSMFSIARPIYDLTSAL